MSQHVRENCYDCNAYIWSNSHRQGPPRCGRCFDRFSVIEERDLGLKKTQDFADKKIQLEVVEAKLDGLISAASTLLSEWSNLRKEFENEKLNRTLRSVFPVWMRQRQSDKIRAFQKSEDL